MRAAKRRIPVTFVSEILARDERILLEARRHPIFMVLNAGPYLAGTIVVWILAALSVVYIPYTFDFDVGGILALILLVVSLVPLFTALYRISHWWREQYVVTSYRIIQVEGLMNRRTFDSALEKVNDVVTSQSLFGRLFNYGTINIVTGSDAAINEIIGVSNPFEFKRVLIEAKLVFSRSGFGDDGFAASPGLANRGASSVNTDRLSHIKNQDDQSRAVIALTELRNSGIISDAEFDEKLRQITGAR